MLRYFRYLRRSFALSAVLFSVGTAHTAVAAPLYELWPHCDDSSYQSSEGGIYIPDFNNILISLGDGNTCSRFSAVNPEQLQTKQFAPGETFMFDVLIDNADEEDIQVAMATLLYEPSILTIDSVEIDSRYFDQINPGGSDASTADATITLSAQASSVLTQQKIRLATITVTIQQNATGFSIISFMEDIQSTAIFGDENADTNLMADSPASLRVRINSGSQPQSQSSSISSAVSTVSSATSSEDTQAILDEFGDVDIEAIDDLDDFTSSSQSSAISSIASSQSTQSTMTQKQIGDACSSNQECITNSCQEGICRAAAGTAQAGNSCVINFQCASGQCVDGVCVDSTMQQSSVSVPNTTPSSFSASSVQPEEFETTTTQTSFTILEIQNLQVTTEDTNAYLRWDPLESSQNQSYHIYYGTQPGQYIQRKKVPASERSITIRDLPLGVQYYFAIRGVNVIGEESAFSQEVSVVIGSPTTSTSPLRAAITVAGSGSIISPIVDETIEELPGETGAKTIVLLVLAGISVAGIVAYKHLQPEVALYHD